MQFPQMVDVVPEGERETARIVHFEVSEQDAEMSSLRAMIQGRDAAVPAGRYARLEVDGQLMMTDTPMEQRSNRGVLYASTGDVLIAGLGLGMITHAIAARESVESVTVIENNADVIALVGETVPEKVEIIEADIFEWKPPRGVKWDVIYFDIWPTICEDNLDGMARLHKKFARRRKGIAWMDSWQRGMLLDNRRRSRAMGW